MGEVALYPKGETFRLTRRVIAVRINKDLGHHLFVLHFLLSDKFKHNLKQKLRGSTVPRILKPDLLAMNIPDADIELQRKFARVVKQIEIMGENQKKSRKNIDELFNVLMQKAFKGELKC